MRHAADGVNIIAAAGVLPGRVTVTDGGAPATPFGPAAAGVEARTLWRLSAQQSITQLMLESLRAALHQARLDRSGLDAIFVSLVWPQTLPDTELVTLAREAGVRCPVIPVSAGTAGGLVALDLARGKFASGRVACVAVIAACCYRRWFAPEDPVQALLSDGAACLILGRSAGAALLDSYSIGTCDYAPLRYHPALQPWVSYDPAAGRALAARYPATLLHCCDALCRQAGIGLADPAAFHFYDPVPWAAEAAANALGITRQRMVSLFPHYGSLGPAQNFFALIALFTHPQMRAGDVALVTAFAPAAVAIAMLFRLGPVPASLYSVSGDPPPPAEALYRAATNHSAR